MTVYSGWRAGVGDREEIATERRGAKESEGERRRAREAGEKSDLSLLRATP
jgi:hypothetical protein